MCPKGFLSLVTLRRHKQNVHHQPIADVGFITCPLCHRSFLKKHALEAHLIKFHETKPSAVAAITRDMEEEAELPTSHKSKKLSKASLSKAQKKLKTSPPFAVPSTSSFSFPRIGKRRHRGRNNRDKASNESNNENDDVNNCGDNALSSTSVDSNEDDKQKTKHNLSVCKVCGRKFLYPQVLSIHMLSHTAESRARVKEEVGNSQISQICMLFFQAYDCQLIVRMNNFILHIILTVSTIHTQQY